MQSPKLWWVAIYAVAMAYLEAAVVVYLRRVFGIADLLHDKMPYDPMLSPIELGREIATLVMLVAVGWAAGRTFRSRLAFAFFAFGLWDIFYYVWLKVFIGWPDSLLAPDILFLIPIPWWGPVLSPVLVACLSVVGGVWAVHNEDRGRPVRPRSIEWWLLGLGTLAVLYAFMADALAVLPASVETLTALKPGPFNWSIYLAGLAAMSAAILSALRSAERRTSHPDPR